MTRRVPSHEYLSNFSPPEWRGGDRRLHVGLDYEYEATTGSLSFKSTVRPENFGHHPDQPDANDNGVMCYITADCTVIVTLSVKPWRLSQRNAVITTKDYFRQYYGNIIVRDEKTFSFEAKLNENEYEGSPASLHSFNINVEFAQPKAGIKPWIPVSIDPDIRNPKQQNGLVAGPLQLDFTLGRTPI
jgi:hypothetical protein